MTRAGGGQPFYVSRAGPADLPALAALERRGQSHPWTDEGLRAELEADSPSGVLAVRSPPTRIVGYCAFRLVADELQVLNLVVDPDSRRRGLARMLLRVVLAMAGKLGAGTAELDVRAGNAAAIALYAGEGFVATGRRVRYYSSPVEDALLMRCRLDS